MKKPDPYPILSFENQQQWEAWLCDHHAESKGVWLKIAKKEIVVASVSYVEALESALCYGWFDGQKASCDEQFWLQKFTPRGPKSIWSQINCDKTMKLLADSRMRPADIQQIEQAQADGRWQTAYASQRTITVPADFQTELDKHPEAGEFFSTLTGSQATECFAHLDPDDQVC
jgi:uncharacterized protein YdeI (YjbR/CyaY-like superfamily)